MVLDGEVAVDIMGIKLWIVRLMPAFKMHFANAMSSEGKSRQKHFSGQRNFAHVVSTNYSQYYMLYVCCCIYNVKSMCSKVLRTIIEVILGSKKNRNTCDLSVLK